MASSPTMNAESDPASPQPRREPRSIRLSMPFSIRLPLSMSLSFIAGLSLGLGHGMQTAGYRFRAENAHRLPTTPTGWYLYHKSKNYHMMFGGVREGLKMGAKMGWWVGGFFTVEEAVDRLRGQGQKDFFSTVVAGLSVAGGFSLWNDFPLITAARTAKTGLLFGLVFGLTQDAISLARGKRLAYVDFLMGRTLRRSRMDQQEEENHSSVS